MFGKAACVNNNNNYDYIPKTKIILSQIINKPEKNINKFLLKNSRLRRFNFKKPPEQPQPNQKK
jgi:hypothetical protein